MKILLRRHWTLKNSNRPFALAMALGSCLFYLGCGKTPAPSPGPGMGPGPVPVPQAVLGYSGCPLGQLPLAFGCVPAAPTDLNYVCAQNGGQLINMTGVPVCRMSVYYSAATGFISTYPINSYFWATDATIFPRLNPGDPQGLAAFNTHLRVFANDRLYFQGSGGWGSNLTTLYNYLSGTFTIASMNCTQINFGGFGYNGALATNQGGLGAGFYGTDGFEVFPLTGGIVKTITHNGELKVGFNAPYVPGACADLTVTDLHLTRCFDSVGNTYPCL